METKFHPRDPPLDGRGRSPAASTEIDSLEMHRDCPAKGFSSFSIF